MDEKIYRVKVNLKSGEIEVEGDREFVKEEIVELLEKLMEKNIYHQNMIQEIRKNTHIEEEKEFEKEGEEAKKYIKEFVREKNPKNGQEVAVVLAYYLYKYENKETFTADDLKKLWIVSEVDVKPPKKLSQTIIDVKNRHGWFDKIEPKKYAINEHGVYFVEKELPKRV